MSKVIYIFIMTKELLIIFTFKIIYYKLLEIKKHINNIGFSDKNIPIFINPKESNK